jgi:aminoglycoside phosphotransferase (APT) family kinase protein
MPAAVWTPEIHIDLASARQVIERDHPDLASLPMSVLGEGWDNLAVNVGGQWVFRFARRELAARLMGQEIRWTGQLARALDVPIPVAERTGTLSADKPFPYMGHRMLPGTTACRAGLPSLPHRPLAVRLGRLLAQLHSLPVPEDAPRDTIGRGDHVKRGTRALARLTEVNEDRLAQDRPTIKALLSVPAHTICTRVTCWWTSGASCAASSTGATCTPATRPSTCPSPGPCSAGRPARTCCGRTGRRAATWTRRSAPAPSSSPTTMPAP